MQAVHGEAEDPGTVAAIALALITGSRSSVLAGQRDGRSAVALLTAHLDGLFSGRAA
ncbi:hypothetical protein SAMN05216276_107033 [Streptosporangium subroseum]|uniref:Uncharacterized protein n=1 Tax=Streptosporangium subroseum TaxID=106412 RepID=A0A239NVD0_9ACTN|nr:hypothetical protein [Streptosporangium subroseum]SNT58672.1 hypothetical protein SAMN05216276_107033 [Streptosporangium subroseum]